MKKRVIRSRHFSGLVYGSLLLLTITVVGTVGYWVIGSPNATWIDSFYMTFITVATIGYGEVVSLEGHPMGRLFTVFIAIIGIGTTSYLFSNFVAFLIDSDLNASLRRKRMEKEIARITGHYIVCGIGRVGSNVASEMFKTKRPFVVIENNREVLENWLELHPNAKYLHDDAADDVALHKAGLANAAGVFAVTGDDSHNIMISLSVKMLNPNARVVVRLHDVRNSLKARRAGADEIVSPDFAGGMRIASVMVRPHVVSFMDQMLHSDEGLRVEEVITPAAMQNTPLAQLLPRSRDYLVLATHENGKWFFNPADDHLIAPGSALVLMTGPGGRSLIEKRLKI